MSLIRWMSWVTPRRLRPGGPKRASTSIGMKLRSSAKPLCISATTARAVARATRSAGHSSGCASARNSAIASESQIRNSPTARSGTLPLGDHARIRSWLSGRSSRTETSVNGMPRCRSRSQGRSDQDERFLSPMTSVSAGADTPELPAALPRASSDS